jgi:hypothetical protein
MKPLMRMIGYKILLMKTAIALEHCEERSETDWFLPVPFIAPSGIAGDIEEILHAQRFNPEFTLTVKLIPEFPMSADEYRAHEKSVLKLFQRIAERNYPLSLIVSGMNHYRMFENEYFPWDTFFNDIVMVDAREYYSYNAVLQGLDIKFLKIVYEEKQFKYVEDDVVAAYFEHEYYERETAFEKIPVRSVKIPIGSVIQIVLGPEPVS